MRRARLAILILLAFAAAFLAPARATWACPDGHPCVELNGRGFACAGGICQRHGSCCRADHVRLCKHGAPPDPNRKPGQALLEAPDDCHLTVASRAHGTATLQSTHSLRVAPDAALPLRRQPDVNPSVGVFARLTAHHLGYRPPPLLPSGPSRAPPAA